MSPSDFQSWYRQSRLNLTSISQDYAWQSPAASTPSQQQQVEAQYLLQPPEQRQPQRVPSQFYETMGPREFRSWERLNRFSQAPQNHHVWQQPAPTPSSQQQQYDTERLLDQEIEKMRQNHQSQTQREHLRDERQRNLQQCLESMRRQYRLETQQAQYDSQSSPEGSRSTSTLSVCPGIDEDEASVIFDGYRYL